MCGIVGFIDLNKPSSNQSKKYLLNMLNTIKHRGPDGEGIWISEPDGIALGHRRLAIHDLSEHGKQPMFSPSSRYVIIFNGEIYNFLDLQSELEYTPQSTSDTEILLKAIDEWGLEKTLSKIHGQYAFSLWDCAEKKLHLIRDRLGEKPLYYGWMGKTLFFGSELKSFLMHPSFQKRINLDVLPLFLRHGYIPDPLSIYQNIFKVNPGHAISFNFSSSFCDPSDPIAYCYWSLNEIASRGLSNQLLHLSEEQAVNDLEQKLKKIISYQMLSDAPVGAFLSGGIDSSLVVALMQEQSAIPIRTFSIGFRDPRYNEAIYAKKIAEYLGTQHTEFYLDHEDIGEVIHSLPFYYDEPFADSSQIPTLILAKLARNQVTVSLSGDGGDEVFCGYSRYFRTASTFEKIQKIPAFLRRTSGLMGKIMPEYIWNKMYEAHSKPRIIEFTRRNIANLDNKHLFYRDMVSHCLSPENILTYQEKSVPYTFPWDEKLPDIFSQMMYADMSSYLPGDILVKVDRATMAVGLENRAPFLDHKLIEWSWSLPQTFKSKDKQGKWIVKRLLNKYLPPALFERPKKGFGLPLGEILRSSLKEWAEDLISYENISRKGVFDPKVVEKKWAEHLTKKKDWSTELWPILMFEAWDRQYIS